MEIKHIHEVALRLRNEPQLAPFKEWLMSEREKVRNHLEDADERVVKILQGESRTLTRILDLIEDAPSVLGKRQRG